MLRTEFIDNLLYSIRVYIKKLEIEKNGIKIEFYPEPHTTEYEKDFAKKLLESLDLEKQVKDFKIVINYTKQKIEIFKNEKLVKTKNFGRYNLFCLWWLILETMKENE